MLQNERYERILAELKLKRAVKVSGLSQVLGVSESTVRRDINELDRLGRLRKVFGGAVPAKDMDLLYEPDMQEKENSNPEEKEKLAAFAAGFIKGGDLVFIDAGTTTERLIDYIDEEIARRGTVFVTNGVLQAVKLIKRGFNVRILGGAVKNTTEAVAGEEALVNLRKYNFNRSFLGTNGITVDRGFTTPDIEEAMIKAEVVKRSEETFILADHSKFGCVSAITFAGLEDAGIITSQKAPSGFEGEVKIWEAAE